VKQGRNFLRPLEILIVPFLTQSLRWAQLFDQQGVFVDDLLVDVLRENFAFQTETPQVIIFSNRA
jgi:hypothetical protein